MDDRKKRIDDLIKNNKENQAALEALLNEYGETLYIRIKDTEENVPSPGISQYKKCLEDIASANISIAKIEEKNRRFVELENSISAKEQEEKERAKKMAGIYRRLGKALLENSNYDDFTSLFKEQSEALKSKLESLESRIGEVDNKEGGNVFSWIGKSAQGLVLKSFLTKAQESQEQLYHTIGTQYADREALDSEDEVAGIRREIDDLREISKTVQSEIAVLKDEKRVISAGFGIDGNPQKQIQTIQKQIAEINDDLKSLYRKFASQVTGIDEDITPEQRYFIDSIVTAEDGEIIGRAARLNKAIIDNSAAIEKLKISLAIDEEKTKIERYCKAILDKKKRIEEMQKEIEDLEKNVDNSNIKIKELEGIEV